MKVYFSTSMGQMTEATKKSSIRILKYLTEKGFTIVTSTALEGLLKTGKIQEQSEDQALVAQRNLTKLKKQADIVVFEVSRPSLGVGQEINSALSLNKPIIALHEEGVDPHILRDEAGDLLIMSKYNEKNLEDNLKESLDYAESHQDVRFNFFISPTIGQYLDWISRNKKIPRSVYLRNLIEQDMARNSDYRVHNN